MNKTLLIIKREYLTRIRNKTFILSTILTPLLFVGMIAVSIYFTSKNSEEVTIGVYDETQSFAPHLESGTNIQYKIISEAVYDSVVKGNEVHSVSGVLLIPEMDINHPDGVRYLSNQQLGIFTSSTIEDDLNDILENQRMIDANIDTARLNLIKKNPISLSQTITGEDGNTEANSGVSYAVGYGSGILIYFIMFVYGAMVMRGVMEEKVNRIAEVVVSSVKPMQLMMGKIFGIGAVGLTQFLIWLVLIMVGSMALGTFMAPDNIEEISKAGMATAEQNKILEGMQMVNAQINIPLILGFFLFYFITGYLFYASLFAAVGSAVNEDPQDAQSMMFPITIPIIFAFVAMNAAITNPTGSLAVWCSIIPFTSPIIMMARIPFGMPGTVPYWQMALSVVSMILGIFIVMWFSARIYRTGILMYGKKPSWKEMLKWVFIKR